MEDVVWAALDRKAMVVIKLTLPKNVAFNIVKETTTSRLMNVKHGKVEEQKEVKEETDQSRERGASKRQGRTSNVGSAKKLGKSWILDCGASFHATYNTKMVKNLRTGKLGKVRLVDHRTLDITGICDVDIKTSFGTTTTRNLGNSGDANSSDRGNSSDIWKTRELSVLLPLSLLMVSLLLPKKNPPKFPSYLSLLLMVSPLLVHVVANALVAAIDVVAIGDSGDLEEVVRGGGGGLVVVWRWW
ncbi:hypothetical protein OSB04_029194 [Centaurea solstitialis]|uniref:Retrovirus-related Pol polyprotein from transposon TNT 1-94-like beta-barrel domain-containing protein n=1 Tax=Centaurea solstitialis TaxID=347529 RepID=A0AA38SPP3_9ASTR|nr:hypothetical protein OSB04_029194 [Centaurea solstitialis]